MPASPQDKAPPSLAAVAVATAIIAGLTGYYIGQARSIGLFGGSSSPKQAKSRHGKQEEEEEEEEESSDMSDGSSEGGDELGDVKSFADSNEECKLVLVTRTDLGMTKGKIAAQCSHATLACYKALVRSDPAHPILRRWERLGQAKVAVRVDSEDDLLMLQAQAVSLGLCAKVIHDAGRTQIASGSATVLGVGPGPKSVVDQVTSHLKLL
ncbi:uncharacterized protein LTR77_000331 [Saxophila tyrrhenica]|uniref:peptidyl-tRNA hydrolase n=1 Tax=Saxophila tyrrhenica TaxID=1690608 RepID=A0AAV9PQ73_9PEZI|nr:hypothetical protein LTR77_000331 [Saxophila tyrrhenica]